MGYSKVPVMRWAVLAVIIATFMCCYAYALAIVQPSVPVFMDVFSIDMPTALLLASALCITATAMSIPAGLLTDKLGVRLLDVASLAIVLAGWAISCMGNDFWVILVGRSLVGVGTTILGVVSPLIIASWFPQRELGLAMGLGFIGTPLGVAWGVPLASWLIERHGWKSAYVLGFVLALILLLTHIALVKPGPFGHLSKPIAKGKLSLWSALKNVEVWKFAIAVFFAIVVFQTVMSSYQSWLMEVKGLEMGVAGTIAGLIGLIGAPTVTFSGWLSNKIWGGAKGVFSLGAYSLIVPLALFIYVQGLLLTAITILLGFTLYTIIPHALAIIPPRLVEPVYSGTSLGVALFSFNLAGIIGPPLMGLVYTSNGIMWTCTLLSIFALIAGTVNVVVKVKQ